MHAQHGMVCEASTCCTTVVCRQSAMYHSQTTICSPLSRGIANTSIARSSPPLNGNGNANANSNRNGNQARKRCMELSESITYLREDYRKANRTLDKLKADGVIVEVPKDKKAAG